MALGTTVCPTWPHPGHVDFLWSPLCIRTPRWNSSRPLSVSQLLALIFPDSLTLVPWVCTHTLAAIPPPCSEDCRMPGTQKAPIRYAFINKQVFHSPHTHTSAHTHQHYPSIRTHSLAHSPTGRLSPFLLAHLAPTAMLVLASRGQTVHQSKLEVGKVLPKILPSL